MTATKKMTARQSCKAMALLLKGADQKISDLRVELAALRWSAEQKIKALEQRIRDRDDCLTGKLLRIADPPTEKEPLGSWHAEYRRDPIPVRIFIDFNDGPAAVTEVRFSPALFALRRDGARHQMSQEEIWYMQQDEAVWQTRLMIGGS